MQNFLIQNSVIHDAVGTSCGIAVGGPSSNGLIQNNVVHHTDSGICLDVDAENPNAGFTPHTVKGNNV
jgi:hypothetical protein